MRFLVFINQYIVVTAGYINTLSLTPFKIELNGANGSIMMYKDKKFKSIELLINEQYGYVQIDDKEPEEVVSFLLMENEGPYSDSLLAIDNGDWRQHQIAFIPTTPREGNKIEFSSHYTAIAGFLPDPKCLTHIETIVFGSKREILTIDLKTNSLNLKSRYVPTIDEELTKTMIEVNWRNHLCYTIESKSVKVYIELEVLKNGLVRVSYMGYQKEGYNYCEWCLITFTEENHDTEPILNKNPIKSRVQDRKEIVDAE